MESRLADGGFPVTSTSRVIPRNVTTWLARHVTTRLERHVTTRLPRHVFGGLAPLALIVCTCAPARAAGYIGPWSGVVVSSSANATAGGLGASGGLVTGIVGVEFDVGYHFDFFRRSGGVGNNDVLDGMANVVLLVPTTRLRLERARKRERGRWGWGPNDKTMTRAIRPYLTAGGGVLRSELTKVVSGSHVHAAANDLGFDAGVGVLWFFAPHIGLRGDLRYLASGSSAPLSAPGAGRLQFLRFAFGLVAG